MAWEVVQQDLLCALIQDGWPGFQRHKSVEVQVFVRTPPLMSRAFHYAHFVSGYKVTETEK